jgi:hypothetical protein
VCGGAGARSGSGLVICGGGRQQASVTATKPPLPPVLAHPLASCRSTHCSGMLLFVCVPVVGMNLTQKMFAVCRVLWATMGLLLCRSHKLMCKSSEPDASSEPAQNRRQTPPPRRRHCPECPVLAPLCRCWIKQRHNSNNRELLTGLV